MATKQVTLSTWENIALIRDKAEMIATHLNPKNLADPRLIAMEDMGKEIARMGELFIMLKEGISALPKIPVPGPSQQVEASRRN